MANKITVNLPVFVTSTDLLNAGMYGTDARLRIQTAATKGGSFADLTGTGSTPTVTITAGAESYTAYDPAGAVTAWYRARIESLDATRLSEWSAQRLTMGI
jgi:hypothetical protein